jgi:hypothetical protein
MSMSSIYHNKLKATYSKELYMGTCDVIAMSTICHRKLKATYSKELYLGTYDVSATMPSGATQLPLFVFGGAGDVWTWVQIRVWAGPLASGMCAVGRLACAS